MHWLFASYHEKPAIEIGFKIAWTRSQTSDASLPRSIPLQRNILSRPSCKTVRRETEKLLNAFGRRGEERREQAKLSTWQSITFGAHKAQRRLRSPSQDGNPATSVHVHEHQEHNQSDLDSFQRTSVHVNFYKASEVCVIRFRNEGIIENFFFIGTQVKIWISRG